MTEVMVAAGRCVIWRCEGVPEEGSAACAAHLEGLLQELPPCEHGGTAFCKKCWNEARATEGAPSLRAERARARYLSDPEYRERQKRRKREQKRRRRATDPAWAERERERKRQYNKGRRLASARLPGQLATTEGNTGQ